MTMDLTYYRPAASEAELSAYFTERSELRRSFEQDPFSITGDRWWGTHQYDTAEEYDVEADRLGTDKSGELSILVFERPKFLSMRSSTTRISTCSARLSTSSTRSPASRDC